MNGKRNLTPDNKVPVYYAQTYARWYKYFSHVYDPFVRVFGFVFNGGFGGERRLRRYIVDLIDPQPGERIIDVCSGTGTLSIMLAERLTEAGEVVGIELSSAQIQVARKKRMPGNLVFVEGDAQKIAYRDGYFDKGVIFGALHELPREVRAKVLLELHRLVKDGGTIVVLEHNRPAGKWRRVLYDFLERFNPEYPTYKDLLANGLINEMTQAGFEVRKTDILCREFFQVAVAGRK